MGISENTGDFGELVKVRKYVTHVEEVLHEFGPPADPPQKKGYIAAITANPYAGRFVEDLMPLMEALKPLGIEM
ncbi:MAG: amino acid synthesis family protein, partial [Rhodospirillaceae bacterium]